MKELNSVKLKEGTPIRIFQEETLIEASGRVVKIRHNPIEGFVITITKGIG